MNYQQNSNQPTALTFQFQNQAHQLHVKSSKVSQEWKVSQIFNCFNLQDVYKYLGIFFNYIIQEQQLQQQFNYQNYQFNQSSLINQIIDSPFQIPQEFLDPQRNLQYLQKIANKLKISLIYHYNSGEQKLQPHSINFQPVEIKLETIIAITQQNNMIYLQFGIHNIQAQFSSSFPKQFQQTQWNSQKDFNKVQFPQQFQPKVDQAQPVFQQNKFQFNPPLNQNNFHDVQKNFPYNQVPQSNAIPWQKQSNSFPQTFQKGNSQQSEEEQVLATSVANSRIDDQQTINEELNKSITTGNQRLLTKKIECKICLELLHDYQDICLPCCNNLIHLQCLQYDLNQKAQNYKLFSKLTCCFCEKPFQNQFFMNKIDKKLINDIINTEFTSKCKFCFKCKQKILLQQEQGQDRQISCNNCSQKICNQCFKEYHGNNECKSVRDEIIELLKGQPIVICPFCNLLFTKNENCDHVTCEGCKQDLCSFCSVDRRPILTHGNHFHRYGCAHFSAPNNFDRSKTEEKSRICEYCKQNGPCKFPIDLETYRKQKKY